jgi:ribose 5-phosphate isomerase B
MGAGVVGEMLALEIMDTWLGTEFSHAPRHQKRIDKITALED